MVSLQEPTNVRRISKANRMKTATPRCTTKPMFFFVWLRGLTGLRGVVHFRNA